MSYPVSYRDRARAIPSGFQERVPYQRSDPLSPDYYDRPSGPRRRFRQNQPKRPPFGRKPRTPAGPGRYPRFGLGYLALPILAGEAIDDYLRYRYWPQNVGAWRKVRTCSAGPYTVYRTLTPETGFNGGNCLGGQCCAAGFAPPDYATIPTNQKTLVIGSGTVGSTMTNRLWYSRPAGSPVEPGPAEWFITAPPMVVTPGLSPAEQPHLIPPKRYVGTPSPIPWSDIPHRQTDPDLSPHEQTMRGYGVPLTFIPGLDPAPEPDPAGPPGSDGNPLPPTPERPPQEKEKEKKLKRKGGGALRFIGGAAGGVTEGLDAINEMYEALPEQYRPGYYQIHDRNGRLIWVRRWRASQQQRINAVLRNLDNLDWNRALQNVVKNNFEDRIYANLGRRMGEAGAAIGSPAGLGLGRWDTTLQDMTRARASEQRRDRAERRREIVARQKAMAARRRREAEFRARARAERR